MDMPISDCESHSEGRVLESEEIILHPQQTMRALQHSILIINRERNRKIIKSEVKRLEN